MDKTTFIRIPNVPRRVRYIRDHPDFNVHSIASFWCGVASADEEIHLSTVMALVGATKENPLAFTTRHNGIEVEFARYPNCLPLSIAKAVMQTVEIASGVSNLFAMMRGHMDAMVSISETVSRGRL
jgi:hypothetical protein